MLDDGKREPDDSLLLQFEAMQQFDEDERATAQAMLEGLILKPGAAVPATPATAEEESLPLKQKPRA